MQPTKQDRGRYRAEFVAELHGMTRPQQAGHAAAVLSRAWALRAVLNYEPSRVPEEDHMITTASWWRRVCCRIGLYHDWTTYSTEDGNRWQACATCGKDRPDPPGASAVGA